MGGWKCASTRIHRYKYKYKYKYKWKWKWKCECETRAGKGRDTDRTRETSHPDPGPRRCPLLIATCNHSGRIYVGELEADSLNNANSYQHNTIRIPDDHPGEATALGLNRVVSWDVLGIHSFTLSIVNSCMVCMHLAIPQIRVLKHRSSLS